MISTTAPVTTAKCARCGRTLRSAQSIADGMGPICKAKTEAAAKATAPAEPEAPKYVIFESKSGMTHDLVQLRDGSYRLGCTQDVAKLPKGTMRTAEDRTTFSVTTNGVTETRQVAYRTVCNRCTGATRGHLGR